MVTWSRNSIPAVVRGMICHRALWFTLSLAKHPRVFLHLLEQRLQKEVILCEVYERLLDAYVRLQLNTSALVPHAIHLEPRIRGALRVLTLRIDGVQEIFLEKCCQDVSLRPKTLRQLVLECVRLYELDAWNVQTQAPPDYLMQSLPHLRQTLVSRLGAMTLDERREIALRLQPLSAWLPVFPT